MKTIIRLLLSPVLFLVSFNWVAAQEWPHAQKAAEDWAHKQNAKLSEKDLGLFDGIVVDFKPDSPYYLPRNNFHPKDDGQYGIPATTPYAGNEKGPVLLGRLTRVEAEGKTFFIADYDSDIPFSCSSAIYLLEGEKARLLGSSEGLRRACDIFRLSPKGPVLFQTGGNDNLWGWGKEFSVLTKEGKLKQVLKVSVGNPNSYIEFKDLDGNGNLVIVSHSRFFPPDDLREKLEKTDDYDDVDPFMYELTIWRWDGDKFAEGKSYYQVEGEKVEKGTLKEDQLQVYRAVLSDPEVSKYIDETLGEGKQAALFFEPGEMVLIPLEKGQTEVNVGLKEESGSPKSLSTSRRFVFDALQEKLFVSDAVERSDVKQPLTEGEYNKLVLADIQADSFYYRYNVKPLTDGLLYKQTGKGLQSSFDSWDVIVEAEKVEGERYQFKTLTITGLVLTPTGKALSARQSAWASAETEKEHWIKASFSNPQILQKVKIFWALDKGEIYKSKKVKLNLKNSLGQETEISGQRDDSDPGMTIWEFKPVAVSELIIEQAGGDGPPSRPNLMWVGQVWAY